VELTRRIIMATSSFSGPLKAGNIRTDTGTTVGSLRNVGFVSMTQSSGLLTQAALSAGSFVDTGLVLPANSRIIEINFLCLVAFNGAADTLNVGDGTDLDYYVAAEAIGSAGNHRVTAAKTGIAVGWADISGAATNNVGTDVKISANASNTGAGTGYLSITYLQNFNGTVTEGNRVD
jgi:hypothetical protein|tara:strand:+ start:36 stop:566 length:531 start_codon:yes stop_codon:yes gene_type:complete